MAKAAAAENLPVENNEGATGGTTGKGFTPGRSGNPGGRPKGIARRAREIASGRDPDTGEHLDNGETALLFLASVMADSKEKTRDRMDAARLLLERGFGKPPQYAPIEADDPLDLSDAVANELAANLTASLDELAARRAGREARETR